MTEESDGKLFPMTEITGSFALNKVGFEGKLVFQDQVHRIYVYSSEVNIEITLSFTVSNPMERYFKPLLEGIPFPTYFNINEKKIPVFYSVLSKGIVVNKAYIAFAELSVLIKKTFRILSCRVPLSNKNERIFDEEWDKLFYLFYEIPLVHYKLYGTWGKVMSDKTTDHMGNKIVSAKSFFKNSWGIIIPSIPGGYKLHIYCCVYSTYQNEVLKFSLRAPGGLYKVLSSNKKALESKQTEGINSVRKGYKIYCANFEIISDNKPNAFSVVIHGISEEAYKNAKLAVRMNYVKDDQTFPVDNWDIFSRKYEYLEGDYNKEKMYFDPKFCLIKSLIIAGKVHAVTEEGKNSFQEVEAGENINLRQ